MRILHIIGIGKLPRDPQREAAGGLTRVALELGRCQAARGHRVVVAAVGDTDWRAQWQGVALASLAGMPRLRLRVANRKLDLSTLLPLFILAARSRFDVIHAHEYNYLRYLPADVRVTQFHNDPCRFPPDHETGVWEAKECLAAARYSHGHVAVSRFVAGRLRERYGAIASALPPGFDAAGRIHVVHNGVDLEQFDPDRWVGERDEFRRAWGVGADATLFLYAGALAPEKGVLELARAFAWLARFCSTAHLAVAGGASLWEDQAARRHAHEERAAYELEVHRELAALTAAGRVHWLGPVAPGGLARIYAAVDAVVVPSVVQEAFCLVAAEALAMRKPLVASRVGGLVEFAGAHNSVLVPPADEHALRSAMRVIAQEESLRSRLAAASRESISAYTWGRAADQLDALYTELLDRKDSIVCARPPAFYRV